MPLPATTIVPDGWAARHRPVVVGFFVDTVTVERRSGTTTDSLGTETATWSTVGAGIPALIQVTNSTAVDRTDSAGQPIVISDYYARLDVSWLPQVGDRLTVTATAHTPALVGAVWWVSSVDAASSPDRTTITVRMQR